MLLAFVMVFGLTDLVVGATSSPTLKVTVSKVDIKPSEEVEIVVSLKDYTASVADIMGLQVNIPIDTSVFEFVNDSERISDVGDTEDIRSAGYHVGEREFRYMYVSMNTAEDELPRSSTELFKFKLRAKSGLTKDSVEKLENIQLLLSYTGLISETITIPVAVSFDIQATKSSITPDTDSKAETSNITEVTGAVAPSANSGKAAKTGDEAKTVLWFGLLLLSVGSIVVIIRRRSRKFR